MMLSTKSLNFPEVKIAVATYLLLIIYIIFVTIKDTMTSDSNSKEFLCLRLFEIFKSSRYHYTCTSNAI